LLIQKDEANHMYCPFKFSKACQARNRANKSQNGICEAIGCMAWQTGVGIRWAGEHGYCGLAGKPTDIGTGPRLYAPLSRAHS